MKIQDLLLKMSNAVQGDFNDLSKPQFGGEWYYYYGNGEYGTAPIRGESEILTDSALNRGCFQPD